MNNLIFELKDVSFSYLGKFPALSDINFNIRQGEKIAVIGANGSGKSTLLHILDGLIFPGKGEAKAFGSGLNEKAFTDEDFSRNFRKKVGLVFQNPDVQLFCPTVKDDIVFGPLQLGIDKKEIERRLDNLVRLFELQELLDRSPHQLSIGERRRVAIASTLAVDPQVLLLDEPTAGLDPQTSRKIIDILLEANSQGKTIITSTHDLHIVAEIADTVYVFNREKTIVSSGKSTDILNNDLLLKENNLVHIHAHRHKDEAHVHPHQHLDHHT